MVSYSAKEVRTESERTINRYFPGMEGRDFTDEIAQRHRCGDPRQLTLEDTSVRVTDVIAGPTDDKNIYALDVGLDGPMARGFRSVRTVEEAEGWKNRVVEAFGLPPELVSIYVNETLVRRETYTTVRKVIIRD